MLQTFKRKIKTTAITLGTSAVVLGIIAASQKKDSQYVYEPLEGLRRMHVAYFTERETR